MFLFQKEQGDPEERNCPSINVRLSQEAVEGWKRNERGRVASERCHSLLCPFVLGICDRGALTKTLRGTLDEVTDPKSGRTNRDHTETGWWANARPSWTVMDQHGRVPAESTANERGPCCVRMARMANNAKVPQLLTEVNFLQLNVRLFSVLS